VTNQVLIDADGGFTKETARSLIQLHKKGLLVIGESCLKSLKAIEAGHKMSRGGLRNVCAELLVEELNLGDNLKMRTVATPKTRVTSRKK
jgi:pyridoxine 5'-phosphate synthase PdxJ